MKQGCFLDLLPCRLANLERIAIADGALHVLASASRTGKTAPGLCKSAALFVVFSEASSKEVLVHTDGPWVTCDHMLWGDDFHLNYNVK